MKNLDIRLDLDFFENPKTVKTVRKLGPQFYECIIRLWMWTAKFKPDGCLTGIDEADIEIFAKWEGEEGLFFRTITDKNTNWIDLIDGVFYIHDWAENNPYAASAKERSEQAKKAANAKWEKYYNSKNNSKKDAQSCSNSAQAENEHKKSKADTDGEQCSIPAESKKIYAQAMPPTQPNPTNTQTKAASCALAEKPVTEVDENFDSFRFPEETQRLSRLQASKNYLMKHKMNGLKALPTITQALGLQLATKVLLMGRNHENIRSQFMAERASTRGNKRID